MTGAIDLIDSLFREHIPMAIASSSRPAYIEIVLDTLGLREKIPVWASGEDVVHGKPAPDIFLLAAKHLGAEPSHCVALEDAGPGVVAAKAADMKVIAVPSEWTRSHNFASADVILPSLENAAPVVLKLLADAV